MRNKTLAALSLVLALAAPSLALAANRTIEPLVSTEWLSTHWADPDVVLIDIRSPSEYAVGHVAKAINEPFPTWWTVRDGLMLELPEQAYLFNLLGSAGITRSSKVVIINKSDDNYSRADPGRVAWTLAYAGLTNFAILDGGYTKWLAEGRASTTTLPTVTPVTYDGRLNESVVVSKRYVAAKLRFRVSNIIDARGPEDYFGVAPLVFADRPGHVKSAVDLPTPWMFKSDGTFKAKEDIAAMAKGVLGPYTWKENIVYCGVGGYGSAMWFVLSQILEYSDVKLYDGSIQEWSHDPNAPMSLYQWE